MIHWEFLKPAGPKELWRGLTIRPTIAKSDPRLKAIDNSVALILVPLVILMSPIVGAALLTLEKADFNMDEFSTPDLYGVIALAWFAAHMYWMFSIISKGIVLFRSTLTTISKNLIESGINPNETEERKK